jgi:hypothetical protein
MHRRLSSRGTGVLRIAERQQSFLFTVVLRRTAISSIASDGATVVTTLRDRGFIDVLRPA